MTGRWIAVACAEHVRRGRQIGIMQVGHGKEAPLHRIRPGDRIAYYSPTLRLGDKEKCQAFTAIGTVRDGVPYQADMGDGFRPYRRDVTWLESRDAPIQPLLDSLEFTVGKRNWGYQFRFGLFSISGGDMVTIGDAMGVTFTD